MTQFTHEKVLFIQKLWPTPLPTNTVTPNPLHTSLPAIMYIYAHCLYRLLFCLLFQLHIICYPALGPQGCYWTDWLIETLIPIQTFAMADLLPANLRLNPTLWQSVGEQFTQVGKAIWKCEIWDGAWSVGTVSLCGSIAGSWSQVQREDID